MKLYFVRHGESTANLLKEFSNNNYRHPLTENGIAQAKETACKLRDTTINRLFTSPVLRALQTANVLSRELRAPLEIAEALREWSVGIYEGTGDPLGWEIHRQVQEDWFFHHKLETSMPGGESFIQIQDRFVSFINQLIQDYSCSQENFLLVGHGGLYLAMLPVILRNVDHLFAHQHGFPYASITVAEVRFNEIYCLSWCGVNFDVK
jgi:broad specificity phosphatase PhoE